uniref:GB1/RHD3-type G domain-containing protein n=1 Tax=Panagrolaimus davidi TaxID=227884 RepID=A0A914QHB3_9BILA
MTKACALQIVEHCGENVFKVKKDNLRKIYGDERVANLPLVVLCIAGAARKGKSFMLNFFVDYLTLKEKFPNKQWILNETTQLNGFEFQDGEDRMTLGMWAWNHVFIIENDEGKKIAVSLIDSQGTFDRGTGYEDCSTIFAMTSMFSSIMCFNVFNDLQEDKLNDFTAFIQHGNKIVENIGGPGKLFQNLVFIIRDFQHIRRWEGENGGQKYVEKILGDVSNEGLQKVRDNMKESYEKMYGFVFPHPGAKVAYETTSKISEMDPSFVVRAKQMVETLLSKRNLQAKRLGSSQFLCKDMAEYVQMCVKCFNDNPKFAPKAVQTVNREFMINLEVKRAIETYEKQMDQAFVSHKTGFQTAAILSQVIGDKFKTVKEQIENRIKDQNIRFEIVENIKDEIKRIFPKYQEKNALLLENEKKRLDLIEKQRLHQAELSQKAAEAAQQKREYELQQEQERQEYIRREAETAAQRQREKVEYERKQAKLLEEIEKQRKEDVRKREEEIAKIQALLAKLELEKERERARSQAPSVIYVPQPPNFGYGMGNFGGGGFVSDMSCFGGGSSGYGSSGSAMSNSSGGRGYTHTVGKNGGNYYHGPNGRPCSRQTYNNNR